VELKGNVDFLTADFLDLAAEDKAPLLGHIKGDIAVSDADGSLGIEDFRASVTDSALLKLSIDLVFDDFADEDEIKFETHLDIPQFKPFAAALGTDVDELGEVKFDGTVTGGAQKLGATGTTVVGETTIIGTVTGSFGSNGPLLNGDLATQLLHLSDGAGGWRRGRGAGLSFQSARCGRAARPQGQRPRALPCHPDRGEKWRVPGERALSAKWPAARTLVTAACAPRHPEEAASWRSPLARRLRPRPSL
jgi:hypothetical protein